MIELNISLRDVITHDLGECRTGGRRPFWNCPFHEDRTPSFTVLPDGRRAYCFGCHWQGDAIDYVKERQRISFTEALEYLKGDTRSFTHHSVRTQPRRETLKSDRAAECNFSRHAAEIVQDCADRLYSSQGSSAYRWLRLRGLRPETIRYGCLGFNPMQRTVSGVFLRRGITIPWISDGEVLGIKIRRFHSGCKYVWVTGQRRRGLYFGDRMEPGIPTVVLEGEFDTLLARQEFGTIVNVVTPGSSNDSPDALAFEQLLTSPAILLAYDADRAGRVGESRWRRLSARVRKLDLPEGLDLTDLHRDGTNLRSWLDTEMQMHGLKPTLHPTLDDNRMGDKRISVG